MYLVVIYRLTQIRPLASTTDIAARLAISQPSVTEQLKRLHDRGYVHYEWREGASLTPTGQQCALTTLRKHRLVKSFLVEFLDYGLDEIYEEAGCLQHCMSRRLTDGLATLLGAPRFDPHGQPIPTWDGELTETTWRTLTATTPGEKVIVRQIPDSEPNALRYLLGRGVAPGAVLTTLSFMPNQGPVLVEVAGQTVAITSALAQMVKVSAATE